MQAAASTALVLGLALVLTPNCMAYNQDACKELSSSSTPADTTVTYTFTSNGDSIESALAYFNEQGVNVTFIQLCGAANLSMGECLFPGEGLEISYDPCVEDTSEIHAVHDSIVAGVGPFTVFLMEQLETFLEATAIQDEDGPSSRTMNPKAPPQYTYTSADCAMWNRRCANMVGLRSINN